VSDIEDDCRLVYYTPDSDPSVPHHGLLRTRQSGALPDGGLDQWTREKRPTSTQTPTGKGGSLTVDLHPEIIAKMEYMKELVDQPDNDIVIVDARPSKRYRNDHLHGAESLYWENALVSEKEPLLKSPEQIRQLFTAAGVTGKKKPGLKYKIGLRRPTSICWRDNWASTPRSSTVPAENGAMPSNPWFGETLRINLA